MTTILDAFSSSGGVMQHDADVRVRGSALTIATNTETTVVSRTVPDGYTFKLSGIVATGSASAEWILYDDGDEVLRIRTSPAERDRIPPFVNPIPFAAGHVVSLSAAHVETLPQSFYATLLGWDG